MNVNNIITSLSPINLFTGFLKNYFAAIGNAMLTIFAFMKLFVCDKLLKRGFVG